MEMVLANLSSTRRVTEGDREYLVAPLTLIVPGVLNGSQGSLYYPPEEIQRSVGAWNGIPITLHHPRKDGKLISVKDGGVTLGVLRNAEYRDGLKVEGWFELDSLQGQSPQLVGSIESGEQIELSTGLYTDNRPVKNGEHEGRAYTHVAENYRPDHLAILPDEKGACSVEDGCGVNVNYSASQSRGADGKFGSGGGGGGGGGGTHTVKLPKKKSKINIPQAGEALEEMGYKLGKGKTTQHEGQWTTAYEVTTPSGKTEQWSAGAVKDFVYKNQSSVENQEDDGERQGILQRLSTLLGELVENLQPHSKNTGRFKKPGQGTGRGDVHESAQMGAFDSTMLSEEDHALGADAYAQVEAGHNPISWVADESKWQKAKQAASKGKHSGASYYAVVTHIYKNMGGKTKEGTKNAYNPSQSRDAAGKFGSGGGGGGGGGEKSSGKSPKTPAELRAMTKGQLGTEYKSAIKQRDKQLEKAWKKPGNEKLRAGDLVQKEGDSSPLGKASARFDHANNEFKRRRMPTPRTLNIGQSTLPNPKESTGNKYNPSQSRDAQGKFGSGGGGGGGGKDIPNAVGGRGLQQEDQVKFQSGEFAGKVGTIEGQHKTETKGQARADRDNPSYKVSVEGAGPGGKDYETTIDHKTLQKQSEYIGKKPYVAPKESAPAIVPSELTAREFDSRVKTGARNAGINDVATTKAIVPAAKHIRQHQGQTTGQVAKAIGDKPERLGRVLGKVPRDLLSSHEGKWYLGETLTTNQSREEASMPLTDNQRTAAVDKLLDCCWEQDDRETLEGLTDNQLTKLVKQTEDNEQLSLVANTAREALELPEDTTINAMPEALKKAIDAKKKKKSDGGGDEEEEEEEEVKKTENQIPLTEEQWREQAPQEVREDLDFARNERARQKNEAIASVVGNLQGEERSKAEGVLLKLSTDDIKSITPIVPMQKRTANYGTVPPVGNEGDEELPMERRTWDFSPAAA